MAEGGNKPQTAEEHRERERERLRARGDRERERERERARAKPGIFSRCSIGNGVKNK
jgi:hypothetical protein